MSTNDGEQDSRFRVNRINSTQLHHNIQNSLGMDASIPEDSELTNQAIANLALQPRRSSLVQGLGGGRKKSVSLPKEFDYLDEEDESSTVYNKNFAYYTREALPKMDNYKNIVSTVFDSGRPTMDELRSEAMYAKVRNLFHFYGFFHTFRNSLSGNMNRKQPILPSGFK